MRLRKAMKIVIKELNKDKTSGSYCYSWQSSIAMSIRDNIKGVSHDDANKAAKAFLDLLCK